MLLLASSSAIAQSSASLPAAVFGKPAGSFFALSVGDIDTATKWYAGKLGFQVAKSGRTWQGKARFALLEADGAVVELIQHQDAHPLSQAAPGITESFLVHGIFKMGMAVSDVDATYRRVKERGVPIASEMMPARDIPFRTFSIRDNEGNLIQFFGR